MRLRTLAHSVAAIVVLSATQLHAQQSVGKLEGTIKETIISRSVNGAWVSLVQIEPEATTSINAKPDARGRYHLDSLPAGRYLVQVSSPTLDSLDLSLPSSELTIAGGKTARADFSLPFGAELRDVVCPGPAGGAGRVAVAGRVTDADTDQPIVGAEVVTAWTEISFDKASLKSSSQRRIELARTGPRGEYRVCGVPSSTFLSMQLQHGGRAGAAIRLMVSEAEGAVVRDISLSTRSAPTLAELDSVERIVTVTGEDVTRDELKLSGTSSVTGTVRGAASQPLAGVLVRVRDARSSALTDSAGRFVLGGLPSGTQVMLVRQLGYALTEIPVELRTGKSVTHDVQLTRAITLDSVRVVAARPERAEFETNRRKNTLGKFMDLGEIQRRDAKSTDKLVDALGSGFVVVGRGPEAKVISRAAMSAQPQCKEANIVIDGLEGARIGDVIPSQIAGIEAYRDASSAPANFMGRADCGLIVIWLRSNRGRGRSGPQMIQPRRTDGY